MWHMAYEESVSCVSNIMKCELEVLRSCVLFADKTPAGEAAWLGELSPLQQTGTQVEAGEAEVWQQSDARARKDI